VAAAQAGLDEARRDALRARAVELRTEAEQLRAQAERAGDEVEPVDMLVSRPGSTWTEVEWRHKRDLLAERAGRVEAEAAGLEHLAGGAWATSEQLAIRLEVLAAGTGGGISPASADGRG
jgi:hypothetical protein